MYYAMCVVRGVWSKHCVRSDGKWRVVLVRTCMWECGGVEGCCVGGVVLSVV